MDAPGPDPVALPSHDRRKLINWFFGTSVGALVAAIAWPVLRFVTPPRVQEVSANEVEAGLADDPELRDKGFRIIRFGADPVILVRSADAKFVAFSATCTHLDCIVGFQKEQNRIWCNCHGGAYDLTGKNIAGPPPRPLQAFKVNLVAKGPGPQTIVVSRV